MIWRVDPHSEGGGKVPSLSADKFDGRKPSVHCTVQQKAVTDRIRLLFWTSHQKESRLMLLLLRLSGSFHD